MTTEPTNCQAVTLDILKQLKTGPRKVTVEGIGEFYYRDMTAAEGMEFREWYEANSRKDGDRYIANDVGEFSRRLLAYCLCNPDGSQLFESPEQAGDLLPDSLWVSDLAGTVQSQHAISDDDAKN